METKDLIIGAVIGVFLAWLFLGRNQSQQTSLQLYQMQNRIQQLEYQLNKYNYQYNQPSKPIQPNTYKNDEKWEILRDKQGYISNIRVIRDARTT